MDEPRGAKLDRREMAWTALDSDEAAPSEDATDQTGAEESDAPASPEAQMEALRRLLLEPEQYQLLTLRRNLEQLRNEKSDFGAQQVSDVLPEAVVMRMSADGKLAKALAPTVEETLRVSVERDPQPIADAIYPVILPAIRKAIADALESTLAAVNRTVERGFSAQGWRWRFEAWRSGQSYAEIALRHTLVYRVEQLFLIDRITGLPLRHVVAESVEAQDSALVSGMLTAIQDFVQTSFVQGGNERLDGLKMGELNVLIEEGPKAVLAAVVRGVPGPELRPVLKDVIDAIHLEYSGPLTLFDGDTAPFEGTEYILGQALVAQFQERKRKTSPAVWIILAIVLLLLAVYLFFFVRDTLRWNDFIDRAEAEPGLVVVDDGRTWGGWAVKGLRDPLAVAPTVLLDSARVHPDDVKASWYEYRSLDPPLVLRRAEAALQPPPGVTLRLQEGRLVASGTAPLAWQQAAQLRAAGLTDVTAYDDSALQMTEAAQFNELRQAISSTEFRFEGGTLAITSDPDAVAALVQQARDVLRLGDVLGRDVRVVIVGHASTEGAAATNRRLKLSRAQVVRNRLINAGIPANRLTARPSAADPVEATESERQRNRRVTFEVEERTE
ncbi:MAG: OmpA family protein [Bacteroidota bacterium]